MESKETKPPDDLKMYQFPTAMIWTDLNWSKPREQQRDMTHTMKVVFSAGWQAATAADGLGLDISRDILTAEHCLLSSGALSPLLTPAEWQSVKQGALLNIPTDSDYLIYLLLSYVEGNTVN